MEVSEYFLKNFTGRKKELVTGSLSVLAGITILIAYFQSGPSADSYAAAQAAFSQWEASPQDETLYNQMKAAIHKVPALEKKYEAVIAQKLLNTARIDEGLELAHRSLSRVKDEAPFHSLYAQTSLLIEQGSYQQALQEAVSLKEKLSPASLLFAHNLLRIACLQHELKNRPGEKAAWEELETFLENSPFADLLLANFSSKQVDLHQYIVARKQQLF